MGSELMCPECDTQLTVPQMQLGPGFVVGGFLIKHKLGEGGMGEVYLAKQLSLERDIALKILPSRFTRENSFVVRFLKEVHYQAKMDHPNIVTAYDAGEDNGVYFMAMAYVAGETLEEWLEREGTLPEKDALQVVRQVAKALEYASGEKGIIHRDIKPANIMLTPTMHAKVLDMGLSKNTLEKNSTTVADTLMGTPNYMSPEQIDHPQDLDTRSDMFSLGMSLYHMLTGRIPFEESGYLKTLQRHAREKLEDPRELVPGISEGTVLLLARMLARDPDDRYPDWNSFLEDLHMVVTHKGNPKIPEGENTLDFHPPAPPQPKAAPPQARKSIPAKPEKSAEGIILSVIIGLMLGVTGIVILASQKSTAQPDPQPEPDLTALQPTPAPRPTQTPVPLPPHLDLPALQKELTAIILNYERTRSGHDEVLQALLDLGMRAENSSVSEAAAQQIVRVRRDRDAAVDAERIRLRNETVRILYEQGPEPARNHLKNFQSDFEKDLAEQMGNLHRRIQIWEKQERSQREAEKATAEKWLSELQQQLAPLVINREWPQAMTLIEEAAEEPSLFPVATEVGALRLELLALQSVPGKILESYNNQLHQDVVIKLHDKDLPIQIHELRPDGLLVERTLYSEDGIPLGSAELFIPFSQLSPREIYDQLELLEGQEVTLYRGLLAHRSGESEVSRNLLEEAGTPLALAIRDNLFSLPTSLDHPVEEASTPDLDNPFNRPRFAPRPRLESP
ncbi:serine/threonine-protein kinase [Kiritimatiellaeota bacterium B1221]|nr:serine/threonine-protein kinase [Kiritimatiellaeota bacterium B1221]